MKGRKIIVLDLETQKSFKEIQRSKIEKLKVSVVGWYDYGTDEFCVSEESQILELEKKLREADLIVGFNIRRFDLPVLAPYLFIPVASLPVLDLLEDIEKYRGHRASLDSIAGPTLQRRKIGTGIDALEFFKQNRMEELKRYCLEDVKITKEIYEYGCREGKILFTSSWDYKTYEIPVSWKATTEQCVKRPDPASRPTDFPASLF